MLTQEEIVQLVRNKIILEVNPGDHAGMSGHAGRRTLDIAYIHALQETEGWKVACEYAVITETEFTIYPDNPPYEDHYKVQYTLDLSGAILSEEKQKIKASGGFDIQQWIDSLPE